MVSVIVAFLAALMVQTISGQCLGPYGPGFPGPAGPALAAEALAYGALAPGLPGPGLCPAALGIPATSGGGFMITSSSPLSPTGLSVQTDSMAIEGPLIVTGQLPFLGVVALEGPLPVAGAGAVAYGCGTGSIGILNEVTPGPIGPMYPNAYGPEMGPYGPGYGYNPYPNAFGPGCGPFY